MAIISNKNAAFSLKEKSAAKRKRKGWPKGKKRGPRRKISYETFIDSVPLNVDQLINGNLSDPKMDFKFLFTEAIKLILTLLRGERK